MHPDAKKLAGKPVFRVQVNDLNGRLHWYLASRVDDVSGNRPPCGRFTRGFISTPTTPQTDNGKDMQTLDDKANLFWLKDSWRPSRNESELSIYNKLKAKGIPNLPEIICAGDIQDGPTLQSTSNDSVYSERNHHTQPTKPIHRMVHHRIVSRLLIPLTSVQNAKELLLVGRDVLNSKSLFLCNSHKLIFLAAIATAFHKGNIYHCDVSLGNVMMTEQRGEHDGPWGVLNDWDHALWTDAEPIDRVVSILQP